MSFRQMVKLGHFFSITEERLVLLFVGRLGMGNVWLAAGESGGGGGTSMESWGNSSCHFGVQIKEFFSFLSVRKHSKK